MNASHTQGSGSEINASLTISRRQHVMARPWVFVSVFWDFGIVFQDVAASLGLAVAASAMLLVFDVAASLWPAVAAAAVRLEFDVAASLWPAVAAKDDAESWPPTVAAAAHTERAPSKRLECAAGHSVTDSESLTRCAPPGDIMREVIL